MITVGLGRSELPAGIVEFTTPEAVETSLDAPRTSRLSIFMEHPATQLWPPSLPVRDAGSMT